MVDGSRTSKTTSSSNLTGMVYAKCRAPGMTYIYIYIKMRQGSLKLERDGLREMPSNISWPIYIYIYIYVNIWVSCLVISNIILELYHFNFGTASSSASKIAYIYRSSYIARHFAYTIPFKFQGPLTHLCDLEGGYGGVWAPNFGGAAPGFDPGPPVSESGV